MIHFEVVLFLPPEGTVALGPVLSVYKCFLLTLRNGRLIGLRNTVFVFVSGSDGRFETPTEPFLSCHSPEPLCYVHISELKLLGLQAPKCHHSDCSQCAFWWAEESSTPLPRQSANGPSSGAVSRQRTWLDSGLCVLGPVPPSLSSSSSSLVKGVISTSWGFCKDCEC